MHQLKIISMGLSLLMLVGVADLRANNTVLKKPDYSGLLDYIQMQDLQDPLVVFGAAEKQFDRRLNDENIAFLNKDKALIQNIQSRLNSETLRWKLAASFKQLLVVPENRDEYAQLFEQYCRTAVDYLLDRIHMPSPYDRIVTLRGPLPALPDVPDPKGITVYLVHNLVDEYIEEYLFFTQDDDQNKIRIKLSNRAFDGKIGSVTSLLKIGAGNQFEFTREPYTLWQNSARNSLNVFIVPIEETLHILMRPYTQKTILADLSQFKPTQLERVQQVVDDWIAVEEAIVGGVVWQVMPDILTRFVHKESPDLLTNALSEREEHAQYRLLNRATQLVADLGVDEALAVYRKDPRDFKALLAQPSAAIESAQLSRPAPPAN